MKKYLSNSDSVEIVLLWILGHCSITIHDIANAASKTIPVIPLLNPPDLKEQTHRLLTNTWNTEWAQTVGKLRRFKSDV